MNELFTNVTGEYVSLGKDIRGYYAAPASGGPYPGVVLFPEAFGLNSYIESEVRRLAADGFVAICPDIFHGKSWSYDDRAGMVANMKQMKDADLMADTKSAIAYLDGLKNVVHKKYGCIGFCMGGRIAYMSAIEFNDKFAAAVSLYGGGIAPEEGDFRTPLVHRTPDITASVLMIYGAEDHGITPVEHGKVAAALSEAKKKYELHVHPGAEHGFASRDRSSYHPEAAQASWASALRLFHDTLDNQ